MMWSFQNGFDSNVFLGKWGRRTEIPQCYLHNFTTSQIRLLDGSPNHLIPRPTLSLETEGLVGVEFADGGIGGDNESETNDNTQWDQFWRNLLKGSQTLGDGVCAMFLFRDRSHETVRRLDVDEAALHVEHARWLGLQHTRPKHCKGSRHVEQLNG